MKKKIFIILIVILVLIFLYIIACIVTYFFRENSKVVIDSYDTKVISISELEKIVKVKFTDDCIENPKIDLIGSGGKGISMGDWVAAPNTFVDISYELSEDCLLYTSDAADDTMSVDLGGRRIIKKIFFKQKTAYEIARRLVGSEMCIRDRNVRQARQMKRSLFP